MQIAATITELNKDFPLGDENIRILHDINTQIRMGELTMLVGPSGCGKTTFLSVLSGILSPTTGTVVVMGIPLTPLKDQDKVLFRRKHIGFIFQQYNLLPSLTAAENAAIPLLASGVPDEDAIKHARLILQEIGMTGHTEKLPRQLSGGQQQRVAIARALVHNPDLIVCDEPTAALDAKAGQEILKILRTIADDTNRAVVVVTHDSRIYKFADRILEMSDGRIIGDFKPENYIYKE